ncbi:ETX/MTX2 family pore-forming toxin [Streptococcaceae bacterium ESL0687]|nr:ETX/MTX2 family pore-forming toxin [Streptococcaceae bacterium ESL0687]
MLKFKRGKLLIASLVLYSAIKPIGTVFADVAPPEATTVDVFSNAVINPQVITNPDQQMKKELQELSEAWSRNLWIDGLLAYDEIASGRHTTPSNYSSNTKILEIGDMQVRDGNTLAAHSAYLTNGSSVEQNMLTGSFTYNQQNTVITRVTHGGGVKLSAGATINLPFINGTTTMEAKYDFSSTDAVRNTITKIWNVPAQNIRVPAGHTYQVDWVLKTGLATGEVDLVSQVSAMIPYRLKNNAPLLESLKQGLKEQRELEANLVNPERWPYMNMWTNIGNKNYRNWGKAEYRAEYGMQLVMQIRDLTKRDAEPVMVDSIVMDVVPTTLED